MNISFYQVQKVELILLKLLEKIYLQKNRAVVICQSHEHMLILDSLLWTQGKASFLPHGCSASFPDTLEHPIWLTSQWENPNNASIAVVTNETVAPFPFERIIDLAFHDPSARIEAYKGHELHYWKQQESGGWYDCLVHSAG